MERKLRFGTIFALQLVGFSTAACVPKVPSPPSIIFAEPINIFFDAESTSLNRDAHLVIETAIGRANKFDCGKLIVAGYTDGAVYERRSGGLSIQRAQAVKDELARDGYRDLIAIEGHGSADPFKPNTSGQPEPLNRRVQINFICRVT